MNDNKGSAEASSSIPFDAWAVLDFWRRRWYWLAAWTLILAALGGYLAHKHWGSTFTASAQLVHQTPVSVDESYHPREYAAPSLVLMLQSPQLMESIGSRLTPPETGEKLSKRLILTLDRNNEVADVSATGPNRDATVKLVNDYCAAAIAFTQQMQRQEASTAESAIKRQLSEIQSEQTAAEADPLARSAVVQALRGSAADTAAAVLASDVDQRLEQARIQLNELQLQYTDQHPLVREQQERVQRLETLQHQESTRRSAAGGGAAARAPAAPAYGGSMNGAASPQEIALAERLRALETNRAALNERLRALEPFRDHPPGYFEVTMPASATRTFEHRHRLEIFLFAGFGALLGLIGSAGQILLGEFLDNRIKTRSDVRRVTGLPLIATLGDLSRFNTVERDQWAFRTWTALQSKLSLSPNHGMVCGITSAHPGDGRSTWIELLARAAGACGFRVLTITAHPSAEMIEAQAATRPKQRKLLKEKADAPAPQDGAVPLSTTVLSAPSQITNQLAAVDGPPRVNIPLPGWVWNLERRKQWGSALEAWRGIDHIVIFVELPPASHPETVLLAENIPNLIWLVDSGKSDAAETHTELETLRDARCNLVGAVLNRERAAPVRGRFTRWLGSSAFLLPFALGLLSVSSPRARAQAADHTVTQPTGPTKVITLSPGTMGEGTMTPAENTTPAFTSPTLRPSNDQVNSPPHAPLPAEAGAPMAEGPEVHATGAAFTVAPTAQRAAWQEKLTLGPGDVLSFHLFGSPQLTRQTVAIGPDGRISYLEAENIEAAGLTVDELRQRLNTELGHYRRSPEVYIVPEAYHSKRYYILGTVVQKGAFPLDRPVTIVEAVARAKGFETAMSGGTIYESTDLSHAFLARNGRHMPVNFASLFLRGDLSQNITLEPNDYLYFPALSGGQIYVLGAVRSPGPANAGADASILSVVTERGGFLPSAWKQKILVVRGSLDHPRTFVVNIAKELKGVGGDVELQPGDMVYVSSSPWYRVEEVLDRAATAFVESAVVTWTSIHVDPTSGAAAASVSP